MANQPTNRASSVSNSVILEFVEEGAVADLEELGRMSAIAARSSKRASYELGFE